MSSGLALPGMHCGRARPFTARFTKRTAVVNKHPGIFKSNERICTFEVKPCRALPNGDETNNKLPSDGDISGEELTAEELYCKYT